jgi:hypothetical protein
MRELIRPVHALARPSTLATGHQPLLTCRACLRRGCAGEESVSKLRADELASERASKVSERMSERSASFVSAAV